jgi:hypothetical protein
MTVKYSRLIQGALLTGTITAYYVAPEKTKAVIKKLTFANNSDAPVIVAVFLVPATEAVDPKYLLLVAQPIAPAETYDCFPAMSHVLEPGDRLLATASADNAVNIMASGIELQ